MSGSGRLLALVPNDEVNTLASIQIAELFRRRNRLQLARHGEEDDAPEEPLSGSRLP